jgi:predicted HTH domain antitoxin
MKQFQLSLPEELAWLLKMEQEEFAQEFKLMALIKLYELGKISSGVAARTLGMSRVEFLSTLGRYRVSLFNDADRDQLQADFRNA